MIKLAILLIALLLLPGFIQIAIQNMKLHKIQKNKTNNNKISTNTHNSTNNRHKTTKIHKVKDYSNYNHDDIIQSCMKYMENKKSSIFIVDTEDKNIFEYDKYEFIKNKITNKDDLNIEDLNELISLLEDEL